MAELNTLNLTLPLKQDPETKAKLACLLNNDFNTRLKDPVDKALRDSKIVHFARFIVIGEEYLQVLTEYDGSFKEYTDYFADNLREVFAEIFQLVEGGDQVDVTDLDSFFNFVKKHDKLPLGGYIYTSYPGFTVKDIKPKLGLS